MAVGPLYAGADDVVGEAVTPAVGVRFVLFLDVAEAEVALDKVRPIGVLAERAAQESDETLLAVDDPGVVLARSGQYCPMDRALAFGPYVFARFMFLPPFFIFSLVQSI